MASTATELLVPARFNGPPGTVNGGVMAGRTAANVLGELGRPVEVTLRRPPPLEVAMTVQRTDDGVEIRAGADVVATGRGVAEIGPAVAAVDPGIARDAMARFAGLRQHPFPTCFVCGTARPDGDGLAIWPGPVGPGRVAALFVPRTDHTQRAIGTGTEEIVGPELVWAALDCPGGWATLAPGRPAVLGRMTALISALPAVGEECVVVGEVDRIDGRKAFTRSTAYGADGRELGRSDAVWIEIPPA